MMLFRLQRCITISTLLMVASSLLILIQLTLVGGLASPPQPPPPQLPLSNTRMDSSTHHRRKFLSGFVSSFGVNMLLIQSQQQATPAAHAYEARVIGSEKPSATMAAFNLQIQQTTARLEKDGFPLDSRQDEAKRLSEAMASFSYDDFASSSSNKKKTIKSSSSSLTRNNKNADK